MKMTHRLAIFSLWMLGVLSAVSISRAEFLSRDELLANVPVPVPRKERLPTTTETVASYAYPSASPSTTLAAVEDVASTIVRRENISNEPATEQESTDERPPPSPSTLSPLARIDAATPSPIIEATPHDDGTATNNNAHVETKLNNGLYRIKLAEIITTEYGGGGGFMKSSMMGDANTNLISEHGETYRQRLMPSPAMTANVPSGGKINIIDLYPSKVEDFIPISTANSRSASFIMEHDSNMLSNSLNENQNEMKRNSQKNGKPVEVTDFTGKLLQEQDGVITEIEKKFQLDDLMRHSTPAATTNKPQTQPGFLDRRVKKSFDFPMHTYEHPVDAAGHVDFASTKFNTDNGKQFISETHPEFSTTKFYNSKELYSEMLHKKLGSQADVAEKANFTAFVPLEPVHVAPGIIKFVFGPSAPITSTATVTPANVDVTGLTTSNPVLASTNSPLPASTDSDQIVTVITESSDDGPTVTVTSDSNDDMLLTPSPPSPSGRFKPISRPRVLSRMEEKINSLECDIQNVPQNSHLWRGNETHELMLPIIPADCNNTECPFGELSWVGQAEIQSADVLLVEINDSLISSANENNGSNNIAHNTQVYQVTRPGHEHCDVTEGVLLDITPLVVDGKKLVTLYDKDLTEGINLLIVVSELWATHCVRLKVTVKSDNCGENADCSGKGMCFSNDSMEGYECQCCNGFAGPHCEEIDACSPSPCTNNGICVDLSQGHEGNSYQCLCPYGYTGKNCQYESDPCNPTECMNGGSCVGNSTHFRCDCAPGYTGPLCQHNLNECESSPCVHGICVDQEDGFRCFCQPGFSGELCNFEYNECESNPCLNGAECIDQIGGYDCKCSKGYTGNICQIKVDFCANNPCPEGHKCIDHGNDFSCECPGGRDGPDCNQIPRTQCNVNPCANGGTCWTSGDSFYCACRPGFTGKMCEDEFIVETVVSSSEFMVDDTSTRNFNDKTFGPVVLKSPIEFHNAYIAAGVLAAAIFIVAIVVTICHCKVNQTYRKFSTRQTPFFPILGFGQRSKLQKAHRHWLSGKPGNNVNTCNGGVKSNKGHLPGTGTPHYHNHASAAGGAQLHHHGHQIHDRPFQRHLAMNLENDMYYTVDFSESQHLPLIK